MTQVLINKTGSISINKTGSSSWINARPELERDIIYVAGQSNAGSYHHNVNDNSVLIPYEFTGFKPNIYVTDYVSFYNMNLPEVNTNVPYSTSPRDYWGMEQHMLQKSLEKYHNREAFMIRRFGGGASITQFLTGGTLRATYILYLGNALAHMTNQGFNPRITILWVQGEEDSTSEELYTAYESRLRTLISDTKSFFTPYTTNLRWISLKLMSSSYSGIGGQAINAAFDAVAGDTENVYVFDPATVVDPWSGSHYTKEGLMQCSEGLWEWSKLQKIF